MKEKEGLGTVHMFGMRNDCFHCWICMRGVKGSCLVSAIYCIFALSESPVKPKDESPSECVPRSCHLLLDS